MEIKKIHKKKLPEKNREFSQVDTDSDSDMDLNTDVKEMQIKDDPLMEV